MKMRKRIQFFEVVFIETCFQNKKGKYPLKKLQNYNRPRSLFTIHLCLLCHDCWCSMKNINVLIHTCHCFKFTILAKEINILIKIKVLKALKAGSLKLGNLSILVQTDTTLCRWIAGNGI